MKTIVLFKTMLLYILLFSLFTKANAQTTKQEELDKQVQQFLKKKQQQWHNLNVPYEDGQILHDLIIKNNYQSALEIGTSTGHSTIWIAWALSKTGGKLTTIELNKERQKEAIENLKTVGLSHIVDFKLGNAHQLVKELKGPFDFVFSDADKDWYIQYFKDIDPKLKKGGTFTAHNVLQDMSGISEYLDFLEKQPGYETTIDKTSSSGIAVSRKKQ
ncbi:MULTISPECIES: O-methyltransferase [Olivibacter]|jgi:predicted O-methyltransferase YrrM|uniref:O-methyltransferase n=2 Tax=Olivibacter TaxID=376469 RepID=A0ABV6HSE9_9SPHI|nr:MULTISPECIES: class I SAM-dependent methyltransferase [Olivibacter]MCL4640885.1 class I SAM-dependent methyltransferase [Olivibacter sp. UJ_SKK_5.1]QEL01260.1 methyltransferase domain-containing protein [Olivibacter sp. LS-1]